MTLGSTGDTGGTSGTGRQYQWHWEVILVTLGGSTSETKGHWEAVPEGLRDTRSTGDTNGHWEVVLVGLRGTERRCWMDWEYWEDQGARGGYTGGTKRHWGVLVTLGGSSGGTKEHWEYW